MKINILGWYGKNNIGDEAFKNAHNVIFDGHDIQFYTPPKTPPDSDIFILGGGAVIAPFYLKCLPKNTPKYILGASVEYESEMDLLPEHNFQGIMIRNATDVAAMKSKVNCPVRAIPDLAFLLKPEQHKIDLGKKKKKLGVMITDYIMPALNRPPEKFSKRAYNFVRTLAKELDKFNRDGWDVILLPFSTGGYGNDLRINLDLMAFMETPCINIMQTLTPTEALGVINDLDLTICMKFHAHIFSIIAAKPFLSIDLTRKVDLLLQENNLQELRAGWFEEDEFIHTFEETTEKALSGNYSELFRNITGSKRDELSQVKKEVRRDWLKGCV